MAPAVSCLFAAKGLIHYFQLESYQFPGYYHTVKRNLRRTFIPGALMTILLLALYILANGLVLAGDQMAGFFIALTMFVLSILGGWWVGKLVQEKKAKKALRITARVKRLYVVLFAVVAAICVLLYSIIANTIFLSFIPLFLPLWVALAGLLAWPIEKIISEYYFRDARKTLLKMKKLKRIGITGSYGKTSVKFFLGVILSEKYNTLVTPASFNTPMGVARIIREELRPSHEIFIAEMGARHVGDIKEMCRLVKPQYGILTSVGPQHLGTFKTIERIANTKYELIEALPEDGFAVFPDDKARCLCFYNKTTIAKKLVSLNDTADVFATNIKVNKKGSSFLLNIGDESYPCQTKLLGEHNIQNILLSAAMALYFKLTVEEVLRGISKIEPVEHRLQLISSANGMTIIDDAFNSNPVGASAALKVLSAFEGRRIIITPGMVELGEKETEYNYEFGKEMAKCVDIAILIGKKHIVPIVNGLLDGGFEKTNIHEAISLEESTSILQRLMRAGDVILYENDLPDNYTEG